MHDVHGESRQQVTETTEGRRPEGVSVTSGTPAPVEVVAQAKRRRLTAAYKLRVIETVAELKASGSGSSVGAYLRKEGLYYSAVRRWMQQQERGELTTAHSGRQAQSHARLQAEIQRLRRKLAQTEKKLKKTELIVEIQKKISLLLGIDQPTFDESDTDPKSPSSPKKRE